jgi:hypothetical protein
MTDFPFPSLLGCLAAWAKVFWHVVVTKSLKACFGEGVYFAQNFCALVHDAFLSALESCHFSSKAKVFLVEVFVFVFAAFTKPWCGDVASGFSAKVNLHTICAGGNAEVFVVAIFTGGTNLVVNEKVQEQILLAFKTSLTCAARLTHFSVPPFSGTLTLVPGFGKLNYGKLFDSPLHRFENCGRLKLHNVKVIEDSAICL